MTGSDVGEGLLAVCAELACELERRRPSTALSVGVAAESGVGVKGRFADGRIVEVSRTARRGAALRCVTPEGFHHVASTVPDLGMVDQLLSRGSGEGRALPLPAFSEHDAATSAELVEFLGRIDASARAAGPEISQLVIAFEVADRLFCVAGGLDHRRLVYLTIRAIARKGTDLATGVYTPGISGSLAELDPDGLGREVARRAINALGARPAPVGRFPVVIRGGRGIVLLHEACCHALEADQVLHGSVYADRVGQRIASPLVTIVDDPTMPGSVGSYRRDDEGMTASPTTLVEDGVLRGFLTDSRTAARLAVPGSPNARCESVLDPPLPRMSTTCLVAGRDDPADIVSGTEYGIYAENVGGGEVVESTGEFCFRVTNGYLIKDGRIADPIVDTTIAGRGDRVLREIDAVGDDSVLGAAKCGKFGQVIPVGVSGPTVRVASLLVGGTGE